MLDDFWKILIKSEILQIDQLQAIKDAIRKLVSGDCTYSIHTIYIYTNIRIGTTYLIII